MSILFEPDEGGTQAPTANQVKVDSSQPALVGHVVHVLVRLIDGDHVLAGTFPDQAEAQRNAEALLSRFAQADGSWPLVDQRFLRPEAVVSIDLISEEHRRWAGSPDRRIGLDDDDTAAA